MLAAWRGRGYRSPLPPGLGGCLPRRCSVESGVEAGVQPQGHPDSWTWRPQGPSLLCASIIRQRLDSVQGSAWSSGSHPPEGQRLQSIPEPTPPPGVRSRGLPYFPGDLLAPGGQPQIPRLPGPVYLSPLPPGVNCFAPRSLFHLSLFGPGKWLPTKPKTRRGKTPSVTHQGSVPFQGLGSPCPEME